ncbi:MAG: hypothetical protein NTW86_02390, partial [Candidatus Sumerlaeota bacterium]|nr:hypothetical protein [Candidatus Sumerlaeota bacterium]
QNGLTFLLYTALLLALLLFFAEDNPQGLTVDVLRQALKALRAAFGLGTVWRRNTYASRKAKKRKNL